ncbi:MAG: YdcF family protein [Ruminococcus sp.]|nr:YdcF family protein [Ruminococcus sp.]
MKFTNEANIKHKDMSAGEVAAFTGKVLLYKIFRFVMMAISALFFIWFLLPVIVYGILIPYNLFGMAACLLIFLFYSARGLVLLIKHAFYKNKVTKIIWKIGKGLVFAFAAYALIISIVMGVCASIPPTENASAIILGAEVRGTQPSLILYTRIKAGENYLNENKDAICVATGGLGEDDQITEAQCIYNVLTEEGIDKNRIFLEENATNTNENIEFSYKIIKKQNASKDIAIVTDGFHQARARLIAQRQGIEGSIGAVSSGTPWILIPTYWVREWFGLPYEFIFR